MNNSELRKSLEKQVLENTKNFGIFPKIDYSKGCARYNKDTCDCDLAANQCKHRDYKEYELEQKLSACEIVLGDTQKEVYELKEVIYNLRHSVKLFIEMKGYTKAQVDIPAFVKALENYDNMYKQ